VEPPQRAAARPGWDAGYTVSGIDTVKNCEMLGLPMKPPDRNNRQDTHYTPLVFYCLYVVVALYWGLRLFPTVLNILWYSDDLQQELPHYMELSLLNILVLALVTALAIKAFGGKVGEGLFLFVILVSGVGTTWLNSTVPMVTF
jgi:hypothetical protein